jgi:hypothetical protein
MEPRNARQFGTWLVYENARREHITWTEEETCTTHNQPNYTKIIQSTANLIMKKYVQCNINEIIKKYANPP